MKSFPLIQTTLSRTQQDFIGFVEGHRAALYQADTDRGLLGDTVRARAVSTRTDEDVFVQSHSIEFMALDSDGHWQTTGCIRHALTEIESLQGGSVQVESRFEVNVPGLGDDEVERGEIEQIVQVQLEKLNSAHLFASGQHQAADGWNPIWAGC
jgi:hypothetical protein